MVEKRAGIVEELGYWGSLKNGRSTPTKCHCSFLYCGSEAVRVV